MLQFVCFFQAAVAGGWASRHSHASGRRFVLLGLFTITAVFAAGPFLPNMLAVAAWIIPVGLAGGLIETFSSIMIADLEGGKSSKLLSLSQVFYCVGAIAAPQVVAFMLGASVPWRHVFLILGGAIALIAVFFTLATRNLAAAPPDAPVENAPEPEGPPGHPLREPLFYLMALFLFLYVAIEGSIACWIAVYFEQHLGVTPVVAARRLALLWTGVIIGRIAILFVPRRWTLWPAMFVGTIGMCLGTTLMIFGRSPASATVFLVLAGFGMGPLWPVVVGLCKSTRDCPRFTSGVIGTGALGVAFGPYLSSLVIRHFGLARFFPMLAAATLLLFITMLAAVRAGGRRVSGGEQP
jgi:fucose permease